MALEILQHQEGLGHLFLQASQAVLSLLYSPASQEVLEGLEGPQDQVCRHRVLHFLFLLLSLFLLGDPLCPLFLVVQGAQHYNISHLIPGIPAALGPQPGQVALASLAFLGQSPVSQEYQLAQGALEDQETPVAQGVRPCLDKCPLVCPRNLGDQVVQ